jgi:hypothetical protein
MAPLQAHHPALQPDMAQGLRKLPPVQKKQAQFGPEREPDSRPESPTASYRPNLAGLPAGCGGGQRRSESVTPGLRHRAPSSEKMHSSA